MVVAAVTLTGAWADLLFNPADEHQLHKSKTLDRNFLKWLTSWIPVPVMSEGWSEINRKMILNFSDQLIVTGIAVLVAGFANYMLRALLARLVRVYD
jgi:hypothetical protein